MTNTQDNSEREQLLQRVDDLLVEIISPVLKAVVNGTNPTGLATAGTKKVTDFILADRAAQRTRQAAELQARLIDPYIDPDFGTVDIKAIGEALMDYVEKGLATPHQKEEGGE